MSAKTFAIAGVSGHTGRIAAETLLGRGASVRVIVRDARKAEPFRPRGAQIEIADLADANSVARALEGVNGAYLLVPPNMAAPSFRAYQERIVSSLSAAVTRSGVPHVVFLSSVGAQHPAGTGPIAGLHRAEVAFGALPDTAFSFVRAAYFMENLGGSLGMLEQGILPSFTPPDHAFDMIATADIGRLAAEILLDGPPRSHTQVVELGGPQRTMNEVAAVLGAITGRAVRVQHAPTSAMVPALTGLGLPAEVAEMYREMTEGILSGHVAFEGGHRRVAGTTGLETVLRGLLSSSG